LTRKKGNRRGGVAEPENNQRYIGSRELRELLGVTDMSLWRWVRDPRVNLPSPVKLGANGRNFWWLPSIEEWRASRDRGKAA
jgi:predicted DNA-binding transcriptional regulator AlpA